MQKLSILELAVLLFVGCLFAAYGDVTSECSAVEHSLQPMWLARYDANESDYYTAFRGQFELAESSEVEIRILGASWFNAWLDGEFFAEGPARFHKDFPEYDTYRVKLSAGRHIIAAQIHHLNLTTRMLVNMPPFLSCLVIKDGKVVPIEWRCTKLKGYEPKVRRINPQLGWIEWCDTRKNPLHWRSIDFDDTNWQQPAPQETGIGKLKPLSLASVKSFTHKVKPIATGPLAQTFGYEKDDIPARFFLRDLACKKLPAQGVWRRYDLGRVRLARPRFVLDLPAGAIVEFAYSEYLVNNRVSPYITLSAGASCNLDHYVAGGGRQEFFPLTPKGGRFVEIHIIAEAKKVKFISEEFIERCYHDKTKASFQCGDKLLEKIWKTGIETYRGCAEDALVDNPTRERGQWSGDVIDLGMDIGAVAYSDSRLCRRGLIQCAQCAREDGLVAGLCPGGCAYLPTYSAHWVSGCLDYWQLTGDAELLEELFGPAQRNMAAFEKFVTEDGLTDGLGWVFIDWGYKRNRGPIDIAYNLCYLNALRHMEIWCKVLNRTDREQHYSKFEKQITKIIRKWFDENLTFGQKGWKAIGYHRAAFGLKLGFFSGQTEKDCIEYLKSHILSCFPNDPDAPRNSDPAVRSSRLITPYFAHYAFPALIERGQMDFVLDQYRKCWGWMLGDGRTTWVEVFDTRWSHCHSWAGCPTWQLSRYCLGLTTRYDLGKRHFELTLMPGSLKNAGGSLPLPNEDGLIKIKWQRKSDGLHYQLETPKPIYLHLSEKYTHSKPEIIRIEGDFSRVF